MSDTSNGPTVPERTPVRAALGTTRNDGRRRSLPATYHRSNRRRASNRVIVKPASTEVISSLIETLSAISSPAEHHFDSVPNIAGSHSTPASPRPWQLEHHTISESFHATNSNSPLSIKKRLHGVDATCLLHPDHASRKGPSPRRSSKTGETTSHKAVKEPEDPYDLGGIYSIGNVSIEPRPWQSTTSINSAGSDMRKSVRSLRSMRSLKTLGFKNSRDSLQSSDEKVICKVKEGSEHKPQRLVIEDDTPPQSPPPDQLAVAKRRARQSIVAEVSKVPERAPSVQSRTTAKRLHGNAESVASASRDTKNRYGLLNQDCIPTRESSRRHSVLMSSTPRSKQSPLLEHEGDVEAERTSSDQGSNALQAAVSKTPNKLDSDHGPQREIAEDFVNRRIRELKDQKIQRELSWMETSTDFVSTPETPNRNLLPSPLPEKSQLVDYYLPQSESDCVLVEEGSNSQDVEDTDNRAPSPAIASRVKRSDVVGTRPAISRDTLSATSNDSKRRSFSTPQRSNPRLLRRLSRPTSPTTAGKHRKTFSNPMSQSLSDQPETGEGDSIGDAIDDFLSSPRLNQIINDSHTGRAISFSEVGDPQGSAVFCCVGMGLTRFLTAFYDELASTLRLRLITPDRPGVGGSESHADGSDTPLGWPDDVRAICEHLKITKFSILAHSAGAIYALATALRMSQHIRCRVHLLAPWIPPSQMSVISTQQEPVPSTSLPYSQRILRVLPTTFLRAANSSFLSTTSASITTSLPRSPRRSKRRHSRSGARTPASDLERVIPDTDRDAAVPPKEKKSGMNGMRSERHLDPRMTSPIDGMSTSQFNNGKERCSDYDTRLTGAIWEAATTGANPAIDLLVCLERRQSIGFRYVDITRAVVIHHGSKDTRVPGDNVKWLGKTMRRCEVRVLEGEGHGLMASAAVMGSVLTEMAQEWDDWNRIVRGRGGLDRRVTNVV